MANPTVFDSTLTNPGGTGSTITAILSTHAVGDIVYICVGNTGNTLWTGNPAGWTRIQQVQVGTSANGLLGTWFWHKVVSGDSLPLTNPTFTLGATVSRIAVARTIRGSDIESPFLLTEWGSRAYNIGTANPVRPAVIATNAPEMLVLHDYFQRAATNAPDPTGYTQDEEIVISGTLVGNASEKNVANQATTISNQDASPTSGVRWVAGIIAIPSPDYVYYRAGSQALTASGTSATPTLPTGTSASDNRGNRDLIIATIECAGTPTISPQVGGDWTQITGWNTTTSGNGSTVRKYWALYDGSINTQFNRSTTGEIFVYLSTYRNTDQSSPIGSLTVQQNTSSSTPPFPSLTRSGTKSTVQITGVADATPAWSPPAPWLERNDSNGLSCADQPYNATGSVTGANFSLSAAGPTATGTMEIVSVSGVIEHTRSAAFDAAGSVSTSATFFSIFSRSALHNTAASVSVSGVRKLSRATAIGASGNISSAGAASTPVTTFERSSSVASTGQIVSAGSFLSVFNRNLVLDGAGAIQSASTFLSTFTRSASVVVAGSVESAAAFLSILQRSSAVDASAAIQASSLFFSELGRSVAVQVTGSIESAATFISTLGRSAQFDVDAGLEVSAQFFSTLERSISFDCTSGVDSAGLFFTTSESSSSADAAVIIQSIGQVQSGSAEIERAALLDGNTTISVAGVFFTTIEQGGLINAVGGVLSNGQKETSRSISLNCTASIVTTVAAVPSVEFHPTRLASVAKENRTQSIGTETRTL